MPDGEAPLYVLAGRVVGFSGTSAIAAPPAQPGNPADGSPAGLIVRGARIERLLAPGDEVPNDARLLDFRPHLLAPGTIDVHTHGGAGCSFSSGPPDDTVAICRFRASTGATGLLATITGVPGELEAALEKLAALCDQSVDGTALLGIHVEGPFLSPVRKGAIDVATMRTPDLDALRRLQDRARGWIKMMTVAPELPGALPAIEEMVRLGIVPSVGHSNANYEQVIDGISAGVRKSTHTYNAMRPLLHRDPGTVGAILADRRIVAELIADGVHVHEGAMRVLLNAKGAAGTALVTDAVRYAGLAEGVYERPGRGRLTVANGAAVTDDGTIAGSVSPINRNLRLLRDRLDVPLSDLFRMAATVPAQLLGRPQKGILAAGANADFAIYDEDLTCLATYVGGREVWRDEQS